MSGGEYPATRRQRFYVHAAPDHSNVLNVSIPLRIAEPVDRHALQTAVDRLVARHDALRTVLAFDADLSLCQRVLDPLAGRLVVADASGPWDDVVLAAINTPFKLTAKRPATRAALVQDADGTVLVLTIHHALCDGFSARVIARDLDELYRAHRDHRAPELPDAPLVMADIAVWEVAWREHPVPRYWENALSSDARTALALGDAAHLSMPGTFEAFELPALSAAETRRLREVADAWNGSLAAVTAAAVLCVLRPYTGSTFTFGMWSANRGHPAAGDAVGDFADLVPVPTLMCESITARVVRRTARAIAAALDQAVPLAVLEPLLGTGRATRLGGPLFDVLFNFLDDSPPNEHAAIVPLQPPLNGRTYTVAHWQTMMGVLDWQFRPGPDGTLGGQLVANTDVIPPVAVAALVDAVTELLTDLAERELD